MVGSVGCVERTPVVDCTVRLVIAEVPNSPWAEKTIRSAVTPAPEEGSKPAMVRTDFMMRFLMIKGVLRLFLNFLKISSIVWNCLSNA